MRGTHGKTYVSGHQKGEWLPPRVSGRSCSLEEAVLYWLSSGKKVSEVAAELGVSGWSLNRWRKEMEQEVREPTHIAAAAPHGEPSSSLNALELAKENGRLRREVEALTRQREILKKAITIFHHLRSGNAERKFEMIESLIEFEAITIRHACQALGVSESGFYAHPHKPQRPRRQQDQRIVHEVKEVFEQNYHCYGSPHLVKALKYRGIGCGKTRIRRLMQQAGLCPKQKRRFRPRTTQSDPDLPSAPNVLANVLASCNECFNA